ncbi:hypothetical protein P1J78_19490 [Psychromarinibacter sp. C21-152]|uniref:Uncharacterized protein n=1 Tax=Psychromarinibacter sediminicola TaxID=3033385 RepID=A0AAE3TA60_9RHOB|nr:hypothetical protein [Psychromarinibacter sediminicola]
MLVPSHHVTAVFKALGGAEVVSAEARGDTRKTRVIEQVAGIIRSELAEAVDTGIAGL